MDINFNDSYSFRGVQRDFQGGINIFTDYFYASDQQKTEKYIPYKPVRIIISKIYVDCELLMTESTRDLMDQRSSTINMGGQVDSKVGKLHRSFTVLNCFAKENISEM